MERPFEWRLKDARMFPLHMLVQELTVPENSVAESALVRAGTVPSQVQLHVALLGKCPGAQLALVGALARVNAIMTIQCLLVDARVAAQFALVAAQVRRCCQGLLA